MKAVIKHKENKYQKVIFWCVLVFAFIIRCVYISDIPAEGNQDEAMAAVDAWALSQYGTDHYGMQWPVHFQAWKHGQMSVLLSYCMIPFIKLFGYSIFAVRIPMVIVSTGAIVVAYLVARKIFSLNMSLAVMAFVAINPWQFMQSRWSLDCNLFPHVFLFGFYLLLCGLEKRKYLYISMVFFGLTFYCYGIAVYSVPVFLLIYAIWCLRKKILCIREILISIGIFLVVALPEILTMFINMYGMPTIETPLFTIPFFPESIRSEDILFLNFSFRQLFKNVFSLVGQVFVQRTESLYNALPEFGPMYRISTLFMCVGIVLFALRFRDSREHAHDDSSLRQSALDCALLVFLFMGIWVGVFTSQVNTNRINIIFYPLMFFTIYGIQGCINFLAKYLQKIGGLFTKKIINVRGILIIGILGVYSFLSVSFFEQYFRDFPREIRTVFNADFVVIIKEADKQEKYDTLYVTSNMGWTNSVKVSEILTQHSCQIDALYYQEEINATGGRTLLPYNERYHYLDLREKTEINEDALYVIHQEDIDVIKAEYSNDYDIIIEYGDFLAIDLK